VVGVGGGGAAAEVLAGDWAAVGPAITAAMNTTRAIITAPRRAPSKPEPPERDTTAVVCRRRRRGRARRVQWCRYMIYTIAALRDDAMRALLLLLLCDTLHGTMDDGCVDQRRGGGSGARRRRRRRARARRRRGARGGRRARASARDYYARALRPGIPEFAAGVVIDPNAPVFPKFY
jgi:hypothetical protein